MYTYHNLQVFPYTYDSPLQTNANNYYLPTFTFVACNQFFLQIIQLNGHKTFFALSLAKTLNFYLSISIIVCESFVGVFYRNLGPVGHQAQDVLATCCLFFFRQGPDSDGYPHRDGRICHFEGKIFLSQQFIWNFQKL